MDQYLPQLASDVTLDVSYIHVRERLWIVTNVSSTATCACRCSACVFKVDFCPASAERIVKDNSLILEIGIEIAISSKIPIW